jgi:xylan 1,4-beta-xylosidase
MKKEAVIKMQYKNPIIPGFYPDPSICRAGEDYYLVTSSFEYFPGVPIFHSRDLIHWEQIGHCLTRESQLPLKGVKPSEGIWAPTIRYHEGVFYMTTTNMNGFGNFYVYTDNPAGEWSDPICVPIGGIDPSMTFEDGKVYYTTNQSGPDQRQGISQAEIHIKTGEIIGDIKFIWDGSGGKAIEAPHLYKIGDYYYLMAAEGGTFFTHMETIARSKSPWGPFESFPNNPILTNMQAHILDVHCTGHGDLVEDQNGNWWMVFLGIRISQKYMSHIGRETFLAPVEWGKDGWPIVNYGKSITLIGEGPCLPEVKLKEEVETDHFHKEQLEYCWNYLRNPYPEDYSLKYKKGCMTLWGNAYKIDDLDSPALLARRQRYFECVIATSFEFSPVKENEEAGLIVFLSNEFYYKIVKRLIKGKMHLVLEKRADDFFQLAASVEVEDKPLYIKVAADKLKYVFYYGYSQDEMVRLASAATRFLTCEVAARSFTGTYVGIYASGNGCKATAPASFDYFCLKEQKELKGCCK